MIPDSTLHLDPCAILAVLRDSPQSDLDRLSGGVDAVRDGLQLRLQACAEQSANGRWRMEETEAVGMLDAMEKDDAKRYRDLLERVTSYAADQCRAGHRHWEARFTRSFTLLANRLLVDDPPAVATRLAATADVPLMSLRSRQYRQYFQGLAHGLSRNYEDAVAVIDQLLSTDKLDQEVRGRALNSRAVFLVELERYEDALAGYQQAITHWRRHSVSVHGVADRGAREGAAVPARWANLAAMSQSRISD